MTLRLVSDSTVETLSIGNLQDMAGMARRFADQLDANEWGEIERVVVTIQCADRTMPILVWGEGLDDVHLMGIFEAAKLRAFADHVYDDDD